MDPEQTIGPIIKQRLKSPYTVKPQLYLLMLVLMIGAACKKERNPGETPGGNSGPWTVYNKTNAQLPGDQVTAITIDNTNVKWIGTDKGLARIADSTWTIFTTATSPLPSSFIRALAVGEDGTVWIGTDKGLSRYDGTSWQTYTTSNSLMTDNGIMCLTYDSKNHKLWVGTEKELISIDKHNAWKHFDETEDELILSMTVDKDGALWLGTFNHFAFRGRIRKFQNDDWTFFQLDVLGYASTFPYSLAVSSTNVVYAVLSGTSVKTVVELTGGTLMEVNEPSCSTGLKTILLDQNKIWVGGNSLARYGETQGTCFTLPEGGSNIQAMAMDRFGNLWLGTVHTGLVVYRTK
ncbi:two-component regulator propeller domain-containing protein [Segetibacter sp. 3557_3]|uniref:ligand-binding sensor domain-containing protein n=1 Tax=Segetibacter sp. 3557_3 TaxID=2547429 RepID=UPI0014052B84|nr:two-component regulator propeller domain-containing protein [Segetibacter sp. 3557_3]